MLHRIYTIASAGFKEDRRGWFLYILPIFTVIVVLAPLGIMQHHVNPYMYIRTAQEAGLTGIMTFGMFIVIFMGGGSVNKDVERKTIYMIITKPVRRWEYIAGRFLGLSFCAGVAIVVLTAATFLSILLISYHMYGYYHLWWSIGSMLRGYVFLAIVYSYLSLLILIAVSLLFSTFTPSVVAYILTFLIYLVGNVSGMITALERRSDSMMVKVLLRLFYYAIPDFQNLDLRPFAVYGFAPHVRYLTSLAVYACVYIVIALMVAAFVFGRREIR